MQRFFQMLDQGECRLLDAALEAGFGSYAQFHRVYRKLVGKAPRDYLSDRRAGVRVPSNLFDTDVRTPSSEPS
jgi:AraC-like DNA-binding protein